MSRVVIIYDTKFGNTEKVARALAEGMKNQQVDVDCLKIDEVDTNELDDYDFLAIGGPTHIFGLSKPMKDFLQKLENINVSGKRAFAFDTKYKSRFSGSAGKKIEKKLKKLRMSIVKSSVSAIVKGKEGPLEDVAEETFKQIGIDIATSLQ
ncbi:MAG: flavodoxin family protein [Candidatus Bathyarchaeota archaeon]|nr:MAG: flavodoxin family protein [Candidatus Bathyarchaeota archaeon]